MDRWRKPANILDCVEGDTLVAMPSGDVMVNAKVTVDDDTLQRMFAGYVCKNCFEPQEVPFPEMCEAQKLPDGQVVGCFYKMRDNQLRDLHMQYGSLEEVDLRPRVNKADELERLRELDAYEERTGMRLPDSVKFPSEVIETKARGR
jgi:hypothetical protein